MATKWKKSKLVKALLVVMAVIMSFTLAFSCVECALLLNSTIYTGTAEELVSLYCNGKPDFFDSASFYHTAINQVTTVGNLFINTEDYLKNLESKKEDAIAQIVSSYSSDKADIIKKELEYIAQNYERQEYDGVSIYNENGYSEILDAQIPEVPYEEQKYILESGLTERHARAMLRLESPTHRIEAIHYVADQKLNVQETEQYVESLLGSVGREQKRSEAYSDMEFTDPEKEVVEILRHLRKRTEAWRREGKDVSMNVANNTKALEVVIRLNKSCFT